MFKNAVLAESAGLGSGELLPNTNGLTLAHSTFEDGLVQGRFVKYDTGSVDNLDGSATPQIAGIARRLISGSIDEVTYKNTGAVIDTAAEVVSTGLCTVDVVTGQTPVKYGTVYAVNASGSGANFGKATTVSTDNVDSGWVFWDNNGKANDVWLIAKKELVS